jgi:hypothetical protein
MSRQITLLAIITALAATAVVRPASAILMDAPRAPTLRSIAVNVQPLPHNVRFQAGDPAGRSTWRHPPQPCRACTGVR